MEKCDLPDGEISRYSRQLILPNFNVKGQVALRKARVLIIGAGGLGCPAAVYLVGAGVGTIGLVDHDVVEISNLHRQILHKEDRVGQPKVLSVAQECEKLNSLVKINAYYLLLDSTNAMDIISKYDLVLDCTDNAATRYLLNDACVLCKRPLVSGSALRFEGQLTVYHLNGGPCYRCIFPRPVAKAMVTNCSDGGVIGAVPGTIGSLQALEAIKILTGTGAPLSGSLLVFDGESADFLKLRLQPRNANCAVCGDQPSITELIDYVQFCGSGPDDKDQDIDVLESNERLSVEELHEMRKKGEPHILIDVRPAHEFLICRLKESINIPLSQLNWNAVRKHISLEKCPVMLLCRRGNDSQHAVKKLKVDSSMDGIEVKDISGGLHAWATEVDPKFPVY